MGVDAMDREDWELPGPSRCGCGSRVIGRRGMRGWRNRARLDSGAGGLEPEHRAWEGVRLDGRRGVAAEGYGAGTIVYPRLGQGTFRVLVTDLYQRRCAVTGERTLPVLEEKDRGYVTVTAERRFLVSRRIREEFENGREYYKLDGASVRQPARGAFALSREYLDWHASEVFRG